MEGKKRVVPGEVCAVCSGGKKPSNCGHIRKAALNAQKSAEAIVPQKNEGRAEPIQAGVTARRRAA